MKVLVLGGTGFIGARLVNKLREVGYHVRVITRKENCTKAINDESVEYIVCDILNHASVSENYVNGCSVVFNCAGEIHNKELMRAVHVESVRNIIDVCKKVAREKNQEIHWVQLSSVGAYGPPTGAANAERVVTEDTPQSPVGSYEITKTEADELVKASAEKKIFTYSILRPSNVYGAEMPNNSLRQWAYLIKKNFFFYVGKPNAVSTYVHVDDVVGALLLCGFDQKARGEVFNISNDCSQEYLVEAMAKAMNVSPPRLRLPEWVVRLISALFKNVSGFPVTTSRINALVARTQYPAVKLKKILGYEPKYDIAETVEEVIRGMERK